MKKANLLWAVFAALLIHSSANAKIWRVNNMSNFNLTNQLYGDNFGGSITNPVFKEINQAVAWSTVGNGDTLHIEGSTAVYADAAITKKLVIIGPGYFLTDNPKTSNLGLQAMIGFIDFEAESQGSIMMGMYIFYPLGLNAAPLRIYADNITVKRCRIERGMFIESGLTTLIVIQNYFDNVFNSGILYYYNNTAAPTTFIFNNNICKKPLNWSSGSTNYLISECRNNVFDIPSTFTGDVLKFQTNDFSNNIINYPVGTNIAITVTGGGQVSHNVSNQPLPQPLFSDPTNTLATMSSVFNVSSQSTDGYYQVQQGSAAYQNGDDGTDRGAFGGALVSGRYTLSGLAPIPVVYRASSTGVVTQGNLPVTIKARTVK